MAVNPYDENLGKNAANYQALTPLTFLERSAAVYPGHTAIIHGAQRINYKTFYNRARQLPAPGSTVTVSVT